LLYQIGELKNFWVMPYAYFLESMLQKLRHAYATNK
jgi:hypothetical protein